MNGKNYDERKTKKIATHTPFIMCSIFDYIVSFFHFVSASTQIHLKS